MNKNRLKKLYQLRQKALANLLVEDMLTAAAMT